MSDSQKLSQLPEATEIDVDDFMYIVHLGESRQIDPAVILASLSALSRNLSAQGFTISDFVFRGAIDRVYDLEADPDGLITTGVIQLVAGHNVYVHADLTEVVEVRFPTPVTTGTAPFGLITFILGTAGAVTLVNDASWVWEKAKADDEDPVIATAVGSVVRIRYAYDQALGQYVLSYSEVDTA